MGVPTIQAVRGMNDVLPDEAALWAGIVRAAIEHNLTYERPQRVWTSGPMFRHERPQKGRYRQFHQLDAEALGSADPRSDAELLAMLRAFFVDLGLREL